MLYRLAKGRDLGYICCTIFAAAMQMQPGSDELNALKGWCWQFGIQLADFLARVSHLLVVFNQLSALLVIACNASALALLCLL